MRTKVRNVAASHRAKLLDLARERKEDFQFVLGRWAVERFLYRLSISEHKDRFILKGALLFIAWAGKLHRPTRDLDLLGWGKPEVQEVTAAIRAVSAVECHDGLQFDLPGIEGERIKKDAEYEAVRVWVPAILDRARVRLQIDVGFGDVVDPEPQEIAFPVLLPLEAPRLRAYPPEAMVAEKLHAMVLLGIANSRMKDFFDIWTLASSYQFRLPVLARSIRCTFERRNTLLPAGAPLTLTKEFLEDATKQTQWKAFARRLDLPEGSPSLKDIGELLCQFLLPALGAAALAAAPERIWNPPGPWCDEANPSTQGFE